jgi:hypothetical protein
MSPLTDLGIGGFQVFASHLRGRCYRPATAFAGAATNSTDCAIR